MCWKCECTAEEYNDFIHAERAEAQILKVRNTDLFHMVAIHCTRPIRLNVEYCEDRHGRTGGLL
jgi:hypothetical protein